MELIADGLLMAGAFSAALYCWVLSRRLKGLKNLESGLGGAIATLSRQVDETRASLAEAKAATGATTRELSEATARAEIAAGRLELLLASLHENEGEQTPARDHVLKHRQTADDKRQDEAEKSTTEPDQEDLIDALRNIVSGLER